MSLLLLLLLQPITAGGRDGWYTWFVVHARGGSTTTTTPLGYAAGASNRATSSRIGGTVRDVIVVSAVGGVVAIGNDGRGRRGDGDGGGTAVTAAGLRLNRLQWVTLVDAGHPVVPAFFEHLAYLASAQAGRKVGRVEPLGQLTDARRTTANRPLPPPPSAAAAASDCRCRRRRRGRRRRRRCRGRGAPIARCYYRRRCRHCRRPRGNLLYLPLVTFLLLALLESHLHLCQP
uniref:Putative secreted protein n=1 Tax=Anopheles darlingi TaxID=43151 RepID=A0A2M4D2L8_ANODA